MQPRLRLTTALAFATGVAAFALPAAANAAVTTTFDAAAKQLTLESDAAGDNVAIGADKDAHLTLTINGATTASPQPSDGTISVVFKGNAGNDTVNLAGADLAGAEIDGDDGDDIITGSNKVDAIRGGNGNDRITGFKGDETILGGPGNDVMIWNNGDGRDTNVGGGGVDETLITEGAADDDNSITQNGAITHFERSNAPFSVDMDDIDKLTLTSFSGNDKLATGPGVSMPMVVDAGSGADTITTGDGADLIGGGDDNDVLNGAGGGDRIVGDRGADTMNGGAGDDTTVWNNGDGSDVMNGDDGLDRVETNLSGGVDVSTIANENGRVRYDRTNVGPFSLSIATAEVFELNSLGGDDVLTVAPDVALPLDADGGDGNDTFAVRGVSADVIRGGLGTDNATIDATDATDAE